MLHDVVIGPRCVMVPVAVGSVVLRRLHFSGVINVPIDVSSHAQ